MDEPNEFWRTIASLGEPYVTYVKLLLEADDAAKGLHAAQVSGDRNARLDAELARARALEQIGAFKSKAASAWLLAMRFAMELYPTQTQALIDPVYRGELDRVEEAVASLEHRVDEAEEAVVGIEQTRSW